MKILHVLPDTNLFIQCRPLDQVGWEVFGDYDEIRIVVSRPVQVEIDRQKGKGGTRIAKKARLASGLFRDVIRSEEKCKVIQESSPRVAIVIDISIRADESLADVLDYEERDDQLVGIAHTLKSIGRNVVVLTYDTGPMISADTVGVPYRELPEDWLLPSEKTEEEKQLKKLQDEIADLKRLEPEIAIECLSSEGECKSIDLVVNRANSLSSTQLTNFLELLKVKFPRRTNFGPAETLERKPAAFDLFTEKEVYQPVTDEQKDKYEADYFQWLEACELFFRDLHLNANLTKNTTGLRFSASNVGTRPANNVLVEVEAKGGIFISCADDDELGEDDEVEIEDRLELPSPPIPPEGIWKKVSRYNIGNFESIANLGRIDFADYSGHKPLFIPEIRQSRDPSRFYWVPNFPKGKTKKVALECAQWRHKNGSEEFDFIVHADDDLVPRGGIVTFTIHCSNLSKPVLKTVRVNVAKNPVDLEETAMGFISELVGRLEEKSFS